VTDDDGGVGTAATIVTVNNVAPVTKIESITDENGAEIGIDVPVTLIGLTVNVAGSFTDVGTLDTHTASMDWDDETIDGIGVVNGPTDTSHIYTDLGDYTMTLAVTNDDSGVGTATTQITVVDDEGAIATAIQELTTLADDPNIAAALFKLNGAFEKLEEGKLEEDKLIAGLGMIKQALQYLEAAEAANPNLDLADIKGLLALTAKSVAVRAIEQAETLATKPNELRKIEQAKVLVAEGDVLRTAADYAGAVEKYQQAVQELPGIKLPE
jgi:PKD repeat protein